MPDHWHALFALREPWTLPKFMHDFMSYVARKTSYLLSTQDTAWQDGYVAYYIEQNPVVKGLVDSAEQWDASSASCKDIVTDPWPLIYG